MILLVQRPLAGGGFNSGLSKHSPKQMLTSQHMMEQIDRKNGHTEVVDRQIGVFGSANDVCAAFDVFKRVQQKLAVSRIVVITRDPAVLREAIHTLSSEMEITVLELDSFTFDSLLPFYLVVNLSPAGGFPLVGHLP